MTLGLACATTVAIILLRIVQFIRPAWLTWKPKTAPALILIGLAYILLQMASRRRWVELALGLSVGMAYTLWGIEQLLSNPALIALIDDVVVYIFVFDLTLVISSRLKQKPGS